MCHYLHAAARGNTRRCMIAEYSIWSIAADEMRLYGVPNAEKLALDLVRKTQADHLPPGLSVASVGMRQSAGPIECPLCLGNLPLEPREVERRPWLAKRRSHFAAAVIRYSERSLPGRLKKRAE